MGKRGKDRGKVQAESGGLGIRTDFREHFRSGTTIDICGGSEPPIYSPFFHILLGNLHRLSN